MRLPRIILLALWIVAAFATDRNFPSWSSVKAMFNQAGTALPAKLKDPTAAKWSAWAREQDEAIRMRLEQGNLDSMVNFLLYGNSFTKQPRIKLEGLGDASRAGTLRARVDDLVMGIAKPGDNERLVFLSRLLRSHGVDPSDPGKTGVFIYSNLQRVIQETAALAKTAEQAKSLPNAAAIFEWRQGLMRDRGVSLDTSIFPNYSIDWALRDLKSHGVLREGQIARVAIIGPGLDFSDKNEAMSYDYYPEQTLQPFAVYDSLVRLGLAKPNSLRVSIFDISARVIDHIERVRNRAKKNTGSVIQLPRERESKWPEDMVAYWQSLGERIGSEVAPIAPPQALQARAIRVRPDVVLSMQGIDMNIVLERPPLRENEKFDLIVATNIFIYYDAFERSMALENAGAMLRRSGILLTNDKLPETPGGSMHLGGLAEIPYNRDAVGWYQRQ